MTADKPVYTHADEALQRLNALLPLAARQAELPAAWRQLHRDILDALIHKQRPAQISALAAALGEPCTVLQALAARDLITLDCQGEVNGAYPVTLADTPHHVYAGSVDIHAMCALDALAISPMFGRDCMIRSRCAQSGSVVIINHNRDHADVLGICADLHVGIHWRPTGGCAATSLCTEMVFLCSAAEAAAWQRTEPEARAVLQLHEALRLARDFFLPLLETPRQAGVRAG